MREIGDKLVIATHNPGKLREIAALIEPLGIACVGAEELGLPEPEEIGNTFVDNADLKAREAADLSGLPALGDDSGLAVDALHGMPARNARIVRTAVGPSKRGMPTGSSMNCPAGSVGRFSPRSQAHTGRLNPA